MTEQEKYDIYNLSMDILRQNPNIGIRELAMKVAVNETDLMKLITSRATISFSHLKKRMSLISAYQKWCKTDKKLTTRTTMYGIKNFKRKFFLEFGIEPETAREKGLVFDGTLDGVILNSKINSALTECKQHGYIQEYVLDGDSVKMKMDCDNMLDYALMSPVYMMPKVLAAQYGSKDVFILELIVLRRYYMTGDLDIRISDEELSEETEMLSEAYNIDDPIELGDLYIYMLRIADVFKDSFAKKIQSKKYRDRLKLWPTMLKNELKTVYDSIEQIKKKKYLMKNDIELLWRFCRDGLLRLV